MNLSDVRFAMREVAYKCELVWLRKELFLDKGDRRFSNEYKPFLKGKLVITGSYKA